MARPIKPVVSPEPDHDESANWAQLRHPPLTCQQRLVGGSGRQRELRAPWARSSLPDLNESVAYSELLKELRRRPSDESRSARKASRPRNAI